MDSKKQPKKSQKLGLKIRGKKNKSIVVNLPIELVKDLAKICENGTVKNSMNLTPEDLRKAMYEAVGAWKTSNRDPRQILYKDVNQLSDHVRQSGLHNHKSHYDDCRMADFLAHYVKTGKINKNILKEPNKEIEDYGGGPDAEDAK